jgi:hypothetical protein
MISKAASTVSSDIGAIFPLRLPDLARSWRSTQISSMFCSSTKDKLQTTTLIESGEHDQERRLQLGIGIARINIKYLLEIELLEEWKIKRIGKS